MFRSARRDVVFPQAEHARLAGTIALAWGNERFARPALPFESFVRGVTLHDRGYGQLDGDQIGRVDPARWAEIQLAGFRERSGDPVVDLVVALHVHRLASNFTSDPAQAAARLMGPQLPGLAAAAGVSGADALDGDTITDLCDMIAFDFCLERPAGGAVAVSPGAGAERVEVAYALDGHGAVTLTPWPLVVPELPGMILGFAANGYPGQLVPAVTTFVVRPG
jgi:uncharacterized protein DUF3891